MKHATFLESYAPGDPLAEAQVEGLVIHNVALLGRVSANGRVYREQAMKDAVKLYDGAPVYIDHPTETELRARGGIRSAHDFAGRIRNPRLAGDRVRGDIEVLDREPTKSLLLSVANQMPEQAGMSHRARGRMEMEDGQEYVEGLLSVDAVEFVMEPATMAGLFEAVMARVGDGAAPRGSDQDHHAFLRDKLAAAFSGWGEHLWLEAVYSAESAMVFCVSEGPQEGLWRVQYVEGEDGTVTFGEPKKVRRVTVFEPTESRGGDQPETESKTMEIKDLTLEQLRAGRPDLVTAIAEATQAEAAKTDEVKALQGQLAEATAKVSALEEEKATLQAKVDEGDVREAQRERQQLVATKLAEAKLPEAAVTELFRKALTEAKDEAALDALIEERKALVEAVGKTPAGTPPQQPASGRVDEALNEGKKKTDVTDADVKGAAETLFG